jgi:glycerol uptake facilitator protein
MSVRPVPLSARCLAEALGTGILVFFGLGAVHAAVLTGALSGLWQVAVVWALAVMLAIFVVGGISGAHINPAITVAFAVWSRFPWREVPLYVLSQTAGAFAAAAILFVLYNPHLAEKERQKQVARGEPGSVVTAMCYGEFFPNPGKLADGERPYSPEEHERHNRTVSEPVAFVAEGVGTMLLALVVFAATDPRNGAAPPARLAPAFIGLTVAALIVVIAPLTQACFNPARDVGPRLFTVVAGWGTTALGRGAGFVTVYVVAPILGAVVGGGLYNGVLRRWLAAVVEEKGTP